MYQSAVKPLRCASALASRSTNVLFSQQRVAMDIRKGESANSHRHRQNKSGETHFLISMKSSVKTLRMNGVETGADGFSGPLFIEFFDAI